MASPGLRDKLRVAQQPTNEASHPSARCIASEAICFDSSATAAYRSIVILMVLCPRIAEIVGSGTPSFSRSEAAECRNECWLTRGRPAAARSWCKAARVFVSWSGLPRVVVKTRVSMGVTCGRGVSEP